MSSWKKGMILYINVNQRPPDMKRQISDQLLVDLLVKKDRSAFEFLYDTYSPSLHGSLINLMADKAIAENVLKKAFVSAYFTISDCKGRKGKLFTWMHHFALRHVFEMMRVMEKWPTASQLREASYDLRCVLDTMDAGPRQVVQLMYDKGYSKAKVASFLNLSIYKVDELLQTGLQQLQQYLNECKWEPKYSR
jgi:DNA-directed RNA polymerase specialized sigma24 family protein